MDLHKKISEECANEEDGYVFQSIFRITSEELIKEEESVFTFSDFIRKNVER